MLHGSLKVCDFMLGGIFWTGIITSTAEMKFSLQFIEIVLAMDFIIKAMDG